MRPAPGSADDDYPGSLHGHAPPQAVMITLNLHDSLDF
jgi:hypothetical protein